MPGKFTFQRRGIVEGFFGPPWSMSHRAALFEFGADRGMNTYLYAPKDDPYHRARWREPYPDKQWRQLRRLIKLAQARNIHFVYGFHPGKGLRFSDPGSIVPLLAKAERFYRAGVRTFAVLFDDIPSRLQHKKDTRQFDGSLARAEGAWLGEILARQPGGWRGVEWWICPSYYSEDPLLAGTFGSFEPSFLETLSFYLPENVPCLWTGPAVVSKRISSAHARKIARRLRRPLILWDNYPVNDLAMSGEMHLGPLTGRDPRLPEQVYGYLNNPLLQESLSFIPLATCFDYAANPEAYDPERSWQRVVVERFGSGALEHWLAIRRFCDRIKSTTLGDPCRPLNRQEHARLQASHRYLLQHRREGWFGEFRPWLRMLERTLRVDS